MPRGGARNRSGPPLDPHSARSDARRVVLSALPSEGWVGDVPDFPLPMVSERELELWVQVWRTPQACAWAVAPWRHYIVGQWVRWSVKAEDPEASAALVGAVIRFADQIGLTPAGLKENGWAVAVDEVAAKATARTEPDESEPSRRLRAVSGDQ
jgi:hypothetical protein